MPPTKKRRLENSDETSRPSKKGLFARVSSSLGILKTDTKEHGVIDPRTAENKTNPSTRSTRSATATDPDAQNRKIKTPISRAHKVGLGEWETEPVFGHKQERLSPDFQPLEDLLKARLAKADQTDSPTPQPPGILWTLGLSLEQWKALEGKQKSKRRACIEKLKVYLL